jgi:hypothetical protein
MNGVTGFEVFSWELEVLFKFINSDFGLSMKPRRKILLR